MNRNEKAMFDDFVDMVRKDPASIEGILADNKNIRDKLRPLLKTAVLLAGVEHPEMMPDKKRHYRQSIVMKYPKVPGDFNGDIPVPPYPEAPGKEIHQ